MLTKNHRQEYLSRAYIQAIAGKAGALLVSGGDPDYGLDGSLRKIIELPGGGLVPSGTPLDFQAKSTKNFTREENEIVYDLEVDAYNYLVSRSSGCMFILIVLCLPADEEKWLLASEDELILQNCCYWFRPNGPASNNVSTYRIRIPRTNLLTPESLTLLLDEANAIMAGAA